MNGPHPILMEIANTAVALHRQHFGRGPGSAKAIVTGDIVICILGDVFTPVERTLIEAGDSDRVLETRVVYQAVVEEDAKSQMGAVLGREVEAFLSAVHIDSDFVVDIFMLAPERDEDTAA